MSKPKKHTLDQEIHDRFKAEKKQLVDPPVKKDPGQTLQKVIAVVIAIIAVAGVIYPLISIFQ
ncbi:hypothetical protein KTT66_03565 [Lacticaseibacillus casei]|jgi:hypothetical protein|uniref:DUF4044 domain-containing protein n=4 Tax=Lacticaseibacillus TaxID=2759736 RepID=A0ABY9L5S6_9LACO|nr:MULTISPECIES: hypothetical protein [Lacticaseibacillus]OFR98689.1 hypothetical protein HMPREF2861_05750 [Lactobacillus sp. HMSC068F07]MDE3282101.1 hypothetical protein [Lacticaseibacillus casei]MDE3316935.1 hypothetical protein [Lacticaseibacillus zeae]MDG3061803.1 hypothetical protein [Lacticaseibacillus sp. BCRC 81376]QVI38100.1 hypothetical protein KGS74_03730 [Lacticaseibacillus casei]